jgi:multiple sugar transport system permease protein/raffinose/stachyose/melibiose transport system permease protein
MFPASFLVIPVSLMMNNWHLIDTPFSLILAYTTFSLPLAIWMLAPFFDSIPRDLDDAAAVDGCTKIGTLFRIILPLTSPAIAAVGIFTFMGVWGEYLWGVTLITTESKRTLVPGIAVMVGQYYSDTGLMLASVALSVIVPLFLFLFIQRYLVEALTAGAVKG